MAVVVRAAQPKIASSRLKVAMREREEKVATFSRGEASKWNVWFPWMMGSVALKRRRSFCDADLVKIEDRGCGSHFARTRVLANSVLGRRAVGMCSRLHHYRGIEHSQRVRIPS